MSNNSKPDDRLIGLRIEHDYSHYKGTITKTRPDIRGYNYFVEWDLMPEHNDWYRRNVLLPINLNQGAKRNA